MSEISARRPATHTIALILTVLYGCVSLSGGIIGYAKAGSVPSLVAGGAAGILLLVCAATILSRPIWGLSGAAIISIALLARFVRPLVDHGDKPVSWVAVVMTAGGALVLLACALALGSRAGSSGGCCGK